MNAQMLTLLRGSLANRAFSLALIVVTLACAVALYVGVQNVQRLTRASFENSISGVDLVVAARGSDVQILLNTVFGLGASGNLVSDETVAAVADMPEVAWVVPLALGDSHRGFRVLGTSPEFFDHVMPRLQAALCSWPVARSSRFWKPWWAPMLPKRWPICPVTKLFYSMGWAIMARRMMICRFGCMGFWRARAHRSTALCLCRSRQLKPFTGAGAMASSL